MSGRPAIGFAGMTHLGLVSAAAAAERGFATVCYDPDAALLASIAQGAPPVVEPGLVELLGRNRERIAVSAEAAELGRCELVYLALDVPSDEEGRSDLAPVRGMIGRLEAALRQAAVLVVLSQVPPGFTRGLTRAGPGLYYQVETLIFGRAVERALHPERFIVGCADPARPLPEAYRKFLDSFDCPILPMRYESAELAKIAINCCLAASVSVANTLAELCERIGADWSEIMPALRLDRRIGAHAYLSPGLGIAGGNHERDLATVCWLADAHGADAGVVRAWIANSRHRRDWALAVLHETVLAAARDPLIAVLGLAYKEDTHSTKNSPALALIGNLLPFRLQVYDPVVRAEPDWHPRLAARDSALAACAGADAVAIMTPWAEFRRLDVCDLARALGGRTVIDPFRVLDAAACAAAGLDWIGLGVPRRARRQPLER